MKRLHVHDDSGVHVLLRGAVTGLLRAYGIPTMWAPADRGWYVRRERLADLLAQAQESGYVVKVHRGVSPSERR